MIDTQNEIPVLIKMIRHRTGLTQEKLASRLGVTFPTINRWEQGHTRPSPLAVQRLKEFVESMDNSSMDISERLDSSLSFPKGEFNIPVSRREIIYIDTWPVLDIGTD